jgi:predicted RNase H-like HicB family nuclease
LTARPESSGYYRVVLTQESDEKGEIWTAEHPELLGCHVVARTGSEALRNLMSAREEWIERAKTHGRSFPSPGRDLHLTLVLPNVRIEGTEGRFVESVRPTAGVRTLYLQNALAATE